MESTMKIYYSPDYVVDIGEHTFPTRKWHLVAQGLQAENMGELVDPGLPPREYLESVHTQDWVSKCLAGRLSLEEETQMELRWSKRLSVAHQKHVMGTILAARDALAQGLGLHAGGGAHHAFADHGEGFCMFNDLAAALRLLRAQERIELGAVVDLDVHQGNGTAAILKEDELSHFSIHQDDIYPFALRPGLRRMGVAEPETLRQVGRLDVAVPRGMADAKYLKMLSGQLDAFLERQKPEVVLYQAGVDVWEGDAVGGLGLTRAGIEARDREVFSACFNRGIGVAVTLGGGYAERLEDCAELHRRTIQLAIEEHERRWPN
jgi:acetoin utilization deacetylase AcuC-like enzyme